MNFRVVSILFFFFSQAQLAFSQAALNCFDLAFFDTREESGKSSASPRARSLDLYGRTRNPFFRAGDAFPLDDASIDPLDPKTWKHHKPLLPGPGHRGFVGSTPFPHLDDPRIQKTANKLVISEWGLKIVMVSTVQDAIKHDQKMRKEPLMRTLYVVTGLNDSVHARIVREGKGMDSAKWTKPQALIWDRIFQHPQGQSADRVSVGHVNDKNEFVYLSREDVSNFRADAATFNSINPDPSTTERCIYIKGWFARPDIGLMLVKDGFFIDKTRDQEPIALPEDLTDIGFSRKYLNDFISQSYIFAKSHQEKQTLLRQFIELFVLAADHARSTGKNWVVELKGYSAAESEARRKKVKPQPFVDFLKGHIQPGRNIDDEKARQIAELARQTEIYIHTEELPKELVDIQLNQKRFRYFAKQSLLKTRDPVTQQTLLAEFLDAFTRAAYVRTQLGFDWEQDLKFYDSNFAAIPSSSPKFKTYLDYILDLANSKGSSEKVPTGGLFSVQQKESLLNSLNIFLPPLLLKMKQETAKEVREEVYSLIRRIKKDHPRDQYGNQISDIYFTFNQDIEGLIRVAIDTDRRGQEPRSASGRFDANYIKKMARLLKEGSAFSIEVRDQNGRIIGGIFGLFENGLPDGKSVAYPKFETISPDGKVKRYGIEIATASMSVLNYVLAMNNLEVVYTGMVTTYTGTIGAMYFPRKEGLKYFMPARESGKNTSNLTWPERIGSDELKPLIESISPIKN